MQRLESIKLEGQSCVLEPLSYEHHDALKQSLCDRELWKLWYTLIPKPENFLNDIETKIQLREKGSLIPFAIIDKQSEQAVGMTSYMNIYPSELKGRLLSFHQHAILPKLTKKN